MIIRSWCIKLFGCQEEGGKTEAENWGVVCTYLLLLCFANVLFSLCYPLKNVVAFYARDALL